MFFVEQNVNFAPSHSVCNEQKLEIAFHTALMAAVPPLKAYARSLAGNADTADDLVQETLIKAWVARARFVPGTNIRAWTHVILRNVFYSLNRRARFAGEWNDFDADLRLAVPAQQDAHVALADLARAMQQLPDDQREALLLVGAAGMTCEDVATLYDCAVGTIKSRVSRARNALRALLDNGQLTQKRSDCVATRVSAFDQIMQEATSLGEVRA